MFTDNFIWLSKEEVRQQLYATILGEKNRTYYQTKFDKFDKKGGEQIASWNWAALFLTGFWALYRKMYGYFFLFWGVAIISNMLDKSGAVGLSAAVLGVPTLWFAIYSNSLYHKQILKKIEKAKNSFADEDKLTEHLERKGGVHTWLIWVFIGLIAAILIPMIAGK